MAHRSSSWLRAGVFAALLVAPLGVDLRARSAQDLETHVTLSIELLELSVAEWQERLAVPASESPETRAAAIAAIEKKFKAERDRLYESRSTTSSAHLNFFATHGAEVNDYLEEFPEVKARIDTLSQTVRTLIEQAEARPGGAPGVSQ